MDTEKQIRHFFFGFYRFAPYYGLTVTTVSTVISRAVINRLWRFGVHLARFIGGLSVYCWIIKSNTLVLTWLILSNRGFYVIT